MKPPLFCDTVFGCVTDVNGPYIEHAARLLLSLRWFGGRYANAHFVLCVVGGLSSTQTAFFDRHGARIVNVARFDNRHGPSNKLRFFQNDELDLYEYQVLLDCDTLVVQDPSGWIGTEGFSAKPADLPTVSREALASYLQSKGIPLPNITFYHDIADEEGLPYFNSGVVAINRKWRKQLIGAWVHFNSDLLDRAISFQINPFHVDQASLTAALLAEEIPIRALPSEMNFPAHFPARRYPIAAWAKDPIIIHYHGLYDQHGYIQPLAAPRARLRAQSFNARLHAERGNLKQNPPPLPRRGGDKVVVATGWWSSHEKSPWSIGTEETRLTSFFELWHRQVLKCINPDEIYVTDSHSPLKPVWADYPHIHWVELDKNYGHPNDIRTGRIVTKYSGYTRSVLAGAMFAFCCDADYYVYVEQDCLVRGEDFLVHAIGNSSEHILLGNRTEGGIGIEGRPAAPMLQNSLIIVAKKGLERFISGILSSPQGDGDLSIETIMEKHCSPIGTLALPYGRSRPINFERSHFYAQHLSGDELRQFLCVENVVDLAEPPSIFTV